MYRWTIFYIIVEKINDKKKGNSTQIRLDYWWQNLEYLMKIKKKLVNYADRELEAAAFGSLKHFSAVKNHF